MRHTFSRERHLPQPMETVWRAVTDVGEMRSWFPTRIEIDEWRVGASLVHHFYRNLGVHITFVR